jgi:Ca2+-binding RTX toxin-like protein
MRSSAIGPRTAAIFIATVFAALGLGVPAYADTGVTVSADQNIFGAGRDHRAGLRYTGSTPQGILLNNLGGRVVTFPSITGLVSCHGLPSVTYGNGPDGGTCPGYTTDVGAADGISGYKDATTNIGYMSLTGVFLTDDTPPATTVVPRLDFTEGTGLGHNFPGLKPLIGQVFFIGDGRVGTGQGNLPLQEFTVPDDATRLYLGMMDPVTYDDNYGLLKVAFSTEFPVPHCNGETATIYRGSGYEGTTVDSRTDRMEIVGTPHDDVIVTQAGDDEIRGGGGRDTICSGDGDDTVFGGTSRDDEGLDLGVDLGDFIKGGDGKDTIGGGPGNDTIDGGDGNDRALVGDEGDDHIFGGSGDDILLQGGQGNDEVDGQNGDDRAVYGGGDNDHVRGGAGNDTLAGEKGTNDDCQGGPGIDKFLKGNAVDAGCNTYADIEGGTASTRSKRSKQRRASR